MTTPFPFTLGQTLTAAQLNAITTLPLNDQTASYVAVVGDVGKRIVMNVATANTVTINNSVFSVGDAVFISAKGAGSTTVTAGAGVTINTASSLVIAQHGGGTLVATSAWVFTFFSGAAPVVLEIEALTVGGGGSGGNAGGFRGGGGGGGQHRTTQKLFSKGTLGVIVGAGGSGAGGAQNAGTGSRFFDIASDGGVNGSGGTGGAGGAGATANGATGGAANTAGGAGTSNDITGSSVQRSGGGGGARSGAAGAGGGGNGGGPGGPGGSAAANLGGGGGGSDDGVTAGNGGSGVVIIRYLTAAASALTITGTNGTSATSGSYTVWTFTSTGVLRLV